LLGLLAGVARINELGVDQRARVGVVGPARLGVGPAVRRLRYLLHGRRDARPFVARPGPVRLAVARHGGGLGRAGRLAAGADDLDGVVAPPRQDPLQRLGQGDGAALLEGDDAHRARARPHLADVAGADAPRVAVQGADGLLGLGDLVGAAV